MSSESMLAFADAAQRAWNHEKTRLDRKPRLALHFLTMLVEPRRLFEYGNDAALSSVRAALDQRNFRLILTDYMYSACIGGILVIGCHRTAILRTQSCQIRHPIQESDRTKWESTSP